MNFFTKPFASLTLIAISSGCFAQALDLTAAYQHALEHDADTHAAYNKLLASKELTPQALADLLPAINATARSEDVRQESESSFSVGSGKETNQFRDEGFTVSLRQPLFNWASLTRYSQAKKHVSRAEVEYGLAEQALIVRLTERYLEALQAEANLTLAEDNVSAFTHQLEQATIRFDVGLIAITDVHNAKAQFDLSIASKIAAQDLLFSTQEALREIIQVDVATLVPMASTFPLSPPQPNSITEWEALANKHNLALEMARHDVAIAKKEIQIHSSAHYPTVDIIASHNYSETGGGSFGTGFRNEADRIGLELNLPLFAGGKTLSLTKQAAFNHRHSLDLLKSLQRSTLRGTRDAFRGVTANLRQVQALEQAIISNKSSLDANEVGLEVGTRTIVDVLDAQSALSLAKVRLIEAKKNYILNILKLKSTAGALEEKDVQLINQWLQH